jgi:DNA-binding CsgD family transcriptional regulator
VPSTGTLLDALGVVYAAALQPGGWPGILEALAPVFGTGKVMLFQVDRIWPSASITEGIGLDPGIMQAMRERDLAQDKMWQAALRLPPGAVFRTDDLHPANVLQRGPLYGKIAVPAGIEHVLSANLECTALYFTNICFLRGDAPFTVVAKETLALLVPHLQIIRRVAVGDAGRREALLSFERARQPLVVLDRSGYALHVNQSAQKFLERADGIALKFGRFLFDSVATQTEFERVVRETLVLPENAEAPVLQKVRVARRSEDGPPYAINVVPVQRPDSRALMPDDAGCMVLIYDDDAWMELPTDRLAWLYQLTSAEARICEALYRSGSVDAAAQLLCLTRHTVRSHLKSIYTKFGVSTQVQLMQRLANSVRLIEGIERKDLLGSN